MLQMSSHLHWQTHSPCVTAKKINRWPAGTLTNLIPDYQNRASPIFGSILRVSESN